MSTSQQPIAENTPNSLEGLRPLALKFTRRGFIYTQVKRTQKTAIYRVISNHKILAHEVFRIIIKPANNYIDVPYEYYPGDEDFGKYLGAKSFIKDIGKAEPYYQKLVKEENKDTPISNGGK